MSLNLFFYRVIYTLILLLVLLLVFYFIWTKNVQSPLGLIKTTVNKTLNCLLPPITISPSSLEVSGNWIHENQIELKNTGDSTKYNVWVKIWSKNELFKPDNFQVVMLPHNEQNTTTKIGNVIWDYQLIEMETIDKNNVKSKFLIFHMIKPTGSIYFKIRYNTLGVKIKLYFEVNQFSEESPPIVSKNEINNALDFINKDIEENTPKNCSISEKNLEEIKKFLAVNLTKDPKLIKNLQISYKDINGDKYPYQILLGSETITIEHEKSDSFYEK